MTFGLEGFAAVRPVRVRLITAGHRVDGSIQTRFTRVAEILNQLSSAHLPVDDAEVREHGDQTVRRASSTIVAVDEILAMLAPDLADAPSGDMRVPKQPVRARIGAPPVWLAGTIYVPVGSTPSDGLLNLADRFVPMTDVSLTSAAFPALDQECAVVAVRRDRAHVIQFDDAASAHGPNATSRAEVD
jgi:hypothetical protein